MQGMKYQTLLLFKGKYASSTTYVNDYICA